MYFSFLLRSMSQYKQISHYVTHSSYSFILRRYESTQDVQSTERKKTRAHWDYKIYNTGRWCMLLLTFLNSNIDLVWTRMRDKFLVNAGTLIKQLNQEAASLLIFTAPYSRELL